MEPATVRADPEPCILCERSAWDRWLERRVIRDNGDNPERPRICESCRADMERKYDRTRHPTLGVTPTPKGVDDMGPSIEEQLKGLLKEQQELQKLSASRERAVLITEMEKLIAWATVHEL